MRALPLTLVLLPLPLLLTCARGARAEGLVTVAMDARGVDDKAYKELGLLALQRKLALRLTQAGYAVIAPDRQPRIHLRFAVEGATVRLEAHLAGGKQLARELTRGAGTQETFQLQVIHRAMDLVREAERALPPPPASRPAPSTQPASRPVRPPASRPVRRAPPPAPPPTEETWHLELAGGAMVLYRPDGVDPLVRGSGRIGIYRGLGLRGAIGLMPHVGDELTVVELSFQGGVSWRFPLTRALYLEPALFAGVLQHIHTLDGETGLDWDFLGNLALELGWRFHRYLGLRLWLAPGISAVDHSRSRAGVELWRRSLFRLEGGMIGVLILR